MITVELVLYNFITVFASVLTWAIIIRILLSWFSVGSGQPIIRLLLEITEPVLAPIRRVMPTFGMLDLSPLVALLLINIVSRILGSVVLSVFGVG